MKKMRFSEKQNDVIITTPEDGVTDVIILTNETVVTEKSFQGFPWAISVLWTKFTIQVTLLHP